MEFRQLESFCAVVRYQSFTKAAEYFATYNQHSYSYA